MKKQIVLLKDIGTFAIGSIGSKLILFFMVPLFTNVLTAEEFGTADLVFSTSQIIIPFASLVIYDAVVRFGLSKSCCPDDVLKASYIVLLFGSLATLAIMPLFGMHHTLSRWKWYMGIHIILSMFGSVSSNYLKVIGKNKEFAVIGITVTFITALADILLMRSFRLGIKGYMIASITGGAISIGITLYAGAIPAALKNGRADRELIREMLLFSTPLILNNVSWWVIQSSNKLILEAFAGAAALGLFSVASKIPSLINVLISIFSQAWGISSVREIESTNDTAFYSEVFEIFSVIAVGMAIFISAVIKPFMNIYVGKEFTEAWKYVPLLLASASFSAMASFCGTMYGALKKSVRNTASTLTAAVVNFAVNIVFIRLTGIWGAVAGTLASYLVLAYYRMIGVKKLICIDFRWEKTIFNSALVILLGVLVSSDFYILPCSCLAILLFVFVNLSTIRKIFQIIKQILSREKENIV